MMRGNVLILMMITHRKSEKVDSSINLALLLGDQLGLDRSLHLLDEASGDHHLVRDILTLMIIIIVVMIIIIVVMIINIVFLIITTKIPCSSARPS